MPTSSRITTIHTSRQSSILVDGRLLDVVDVVMNVYYVRHNCCTRRVRTTTDYIHKFTSFNNWNALCVMMVELFKNRLIFSKRLPFPIVTGFARAFYSLELASWVCTRRKRMCSCLHTHKKRPLWQMTVLTCLR